MEKLLKDALAIHEVRTQIEDVFCADEDKTPQELTRDEIIGEVEWTLEKINMDLSGYADDEEAKEDFREWKKDKKKIEKFLKKYK